MAKKGMEQGFDIALLGLDGIGKTTIANYIQSELIGRGLQVSMVSFRRSMQESDSSFVRNTLQELWLGSLRTIYGTAKSSGTDIPEAFPNNFENYISSGFEEWLASISIDDNDVTGPVSASLVEIAANFVLRDHEVDRLTSKGIVVIQETFGFKHVVKELLIARRLASQKGERQAEKLIDNLFNMMEACFAQWLQPDVGIFVNGAPELAYRWRMKQEGNVGVIEDFGSAGASGEESFISLQRECAKIFKGYSKKWDWVEVNVKNRPVEENIEEAKRVVFDVLRAKNLL